MHLKNISETHEKESNELVLSLPKHFLGVGGHDHTPALSVEL